MGSPSIARRVDPMTKQRVLILSPDAESVREAVRGSALNDVHFSVVSDWTRGAAALTQENFTAIVAGRFSKKVDLETHVSGLLALAPKTPIILILPKKEGPSVLAAIRAGVSDVVFEENLERELGPALEKFLFSACGITRRMPLDDLFEFSIPVLTTTDMNLLAVTVLDKLTEALGATFGVLFRDQEENCTGGFSVVASMGFPEEALVGEFLLRFGGGIANVATEKPAVVPASTVAALRETDRDVLGDNRNFFVLRFDLTPGARMFIVMGIRGLLAPDVLNSLLLDFFLRQARFAFLNAERSSQTQSLIYIDDLTKLYNGRYLNVVLDRELKRSERYRNFFSVLFMDVDFFKRINDAHGHLVGSRVLIEIGGVLRSCVRETDTVVRYGGDEFVVVLVETNADEALLVAERMRKLIEAKRFGLEQSLSLHLTISIGIAAFPEHASTKQHLLNMADQAMYRGKESTRNVVYIADPQNAP